MYSSGQRPALFIPTFRKEEACMKPQMPYSAKHYDYTACAGLLAPSASCPGLREPQHTGHARCRAHNTSGGVCPAILPCTSGRHRQTARFLSNSTCTIRPLSGLGFNAAIIRATAGLRKKWPGIWPAAAQYVATDRFEHNNAASLLCANSATRSRYVHMMHSATALSFLDHDFRVVKRTYITGGFCAGGEWGGETFGSLSASKSASMILDARPLELGRDELWLSYVSYWSARCEGSWMAQVTNFGSFICDSSGNKLLDPRPMKRQRERPCGRDRDHRRIPTDDGYWSELHPTDATGGVGLAFVSRSNRTGRVAEARRNHSSFVSYGWLTAKRNGGIIVSKDGLRRPLFELVNIAPQLELRAPDGRYIYHRLPDKFAREGMHNSIHPLWVPELGAYLGVGHRHYRDGSGSKSDAAPFRYGHSYRQVLFTLSPTDFAMKHFSRELCFPSLDLGDSACEGIQFVMSAFRPVARSEDERNVLDARPVVGFSYGVQDCEAAVLTLTIDRLKELLEFR